MNGLTIGHSFNNVLSTVVKSCMTMPVPLDSYMMLKFSREGKPGGLVQESEAGELGPPLQCASCLFDSHK